MVVELVKVRFRDAGRDVQNFYCGVVGNDDESLCDRRYLMTCAYTFIYCLYKILPPQGSTKQFSVRTRKLEENQTNADPLLVVCG